mgnify:CR=1 FL=1
MPLSYILRRVCSEVGITNPDENPEQKARILDIINQGATEVYENKDLPISLKEIYLRANTNKEVALPSFVGELRAIRQSEDYRNDWKLHDIRPRYQNQAWNNLWRNWRVKGYSPFQIEITNAAPGLITVPIADSTLEVTLVGETSISNRAVETIVVDSVSQPWTKSFIDLTSIKKNKITDYNVTLLDADGNELSIIYADQKSARYVIVDISLYPNLSACSDGSYVMEVLYKPRLPRMENDDDEFPVDGFDDIIVIKSKQLILEEQEGKEQRAILAHTKVNEQIKRKTEDKTGTFQKLVKFSRNGLLGVKRHFGCNKYD